MPSSMASLGSLSSPSPSPPPPVERALSNPGTGAGLDSGSELSELTEEEQEAETLNSRADDDDDDDEGDDEVGGRQRSLRRGGRKKRGGIVPAPMWEWAKPRASTVVEEEEEEEMSGPPRAMEEEEDEEEVDSGPTTVVNGTAPEDDDEEEEEEEEDIEERELPPSTNRPKRSSKKAAGEDESGSEDSQYEWYEGHTKSTARRRRGRSASADDSGNESFSDGEASNAGASRRRPSQLPPQEEAASEEDNDTESEDQDAKDADALALNANTVPVSGNLLADALNSIAASNALLDMDVDVTAPSPEAVAPLAAAAAASSIMAGSSVLEPPSPSSSPTPSGSGSPASSRSPSPALQQAPAKSADGVTPIPPRPKRGDRRKKQQDGAKDINISINAIDETASALVHPDAEPDGSAEDVEIQDQDQDPDLELELESDLQPAHRAEALDVLATIELKFALLRERVYVEKMEGLAWEEALVSEGTHPELIHLQAELSKRRDKRLELATRKRSYEIANVTKRRRVDEDAVWSWWKFARDELQIDMISETNRKRRKLERDRRALERPQPVRRIPNPPHDVPTPPTLRKLVKTFPFTSGHRPSPSIKPLVYPELSTLLSSDISVDLDFLYAHRRSSFDTQRGVNPHIVGSNVPAGQPLPPPFDAYGINGGMPVDMSPFGASGSRMPPPPPPFSHQHSQLSGSQQAPPGFAAGPSRIQHHPLHPPASVLNMHSHAQSPFVAEHEVGLMSGGVSGSGSGHGQFPQQHQFHGSAGPGVMVASQSGHGYPNQGHLGISRSISPVHVMPHGGGGIPGGTRGKQGGGWVGESVMSGLHPPLKQSGLNDWGGEGGRGDIGMNEMMEDEGRARAREREAKRDRERDKMRFDREREREHRDHDRDHDRDGRYHVQQIMQPQQPLPPHRHPPPSHHHHHVHTAPGQVPHHHMGPHHHHHHHHVHHHHPQQAGSGQTTNPGPSLSMPPGPLGVGPGMSPRTVGPREFESTRHSHPTEVINLSSSKSSLPSSANSSLWKVDAESHLSPSEYREIRSKHGSRPSSGPPIAPISHDERERERERPLAMPFVMSSSHLTSTASSLSNGQPSASAPPPRGPWNRPEDSAHRIPPSSSAGYSGSIEGHSNSPGPQHFPRAPPQSALSRQNSLGLSSPRTRPPPPHSPPSSSMFPGPMRSPSRYAPASSQSLPGGSVASVSHPPAVHSTTSSHGSVSTSPILKTHRSGSPKMGITGGPSVFSPLLSGPGRTATPTTLSGPMDIHNSNSTNGPGHSVSSFGSRTASPLAVFPSSHPPPPSSRQPPSATIGDKHSPRMSVLPPPKMNVAQMVDGP